MEHQVMVHGYEAPVQVMVHGHEALVQVMVHDCETLVQVMVSREEEVHCHPVVLHLLGFSIKRLGLRVEG